MVTGSCSGRLLWSALRSTSHGALVLCDASLSHILFQCCLVSALGASFLILLPCHCEYSLDSSVKNILFIFLASASLVFLLRQVTRAVTCWFAVSSASSMESLFYFLDSFLFIAPFWSSDSWLTFLCAALILASNLLLGEYCLLFIFEPSISLQLWCTSAYWSLWSSQYVWYIVRERARNIKFYRKYDI